MHATQAWERLQDPDYTSRLSMDGFHLLLRRAGYSEEVAHRAAMEHGHARLNAGETL